MHLNVAWRTPQFWLVWLVLMLNVSAGIGILSMASPLLQEVFGGRLIGVQRDLRSARPRRSWPRSPPLRGRLHRPAVAVQHRRPHLLGVAVGSIGRKVTYAMFFLLGIALYSSIPWTASTVNLALFVLFFCIILSMYGGGFATVPAYLSDLFGTKMVGAIHGRLLTAWSVAGVLGPFLVGSFRQYRAWPTAFPRPRSTARRCTCWRACWRSASSATC